MANSKQAIKRVRQNSNKYKLRHAQRSVVRTAVKAVKANIDIKDKSKATELFIKAQKILDTAASKTLTAAAQISGPIPLFIISPILQV